MDQVANAGTDTVARLLWLRYRLIAAELADVGIDANCAPCADIAGPDTHPFLRNRCFGQDAETVACAARACADGLLAGGVLPVVKHLPGHGRATLDSHRELPRVSCPLTDLVVTDFAPFAALADLPMAMTAHIVFDAVDPVNPATASPAVIDLIRGTIGFDGLLISDDLSMQALSGSLGERSAATIAAGCDIALHCNGDSAEMSAVVAAAGTITGAGRRRADQSMARRQRPGAIDMCEWEAEFEALVKETRRG